MRMYEDIEYARSRLLETVVRVEDEPVVVYAINARTVNYRRLIDEMEGVCAPKFLNINPVKLGYFNGKKNSHYLTRTPMRRDWKQGLRQASIRDITGSTVSIGNADLAAVIKGTYPKLADCFKKNNNPFDEPIKSTMRAFSRNFAMDSRDSGLWYKGKWVVGEITKEKNYKLVPQFDWVRDILDEELDAA